MPKKISAFFLDFDGVIVESTTIKTQAFYDLFLPYGSNIAKKALNFHLQNQGINRLHKFVYIGKNFINKNFTEPELKVLSDEFSKLVFQKVTEAPLVLGVQGFLQNKYLDIPKFVLSATPHEELIDICNHKELLPFFQEVHGGPRSKTEIGNLLLEKYSLSPKEVIFIGDSVQDYKAALSLETNFLGRLLENKENPFPESVQTIENFTKL